MKKIGMIATLACGVAMLGATPAASNAPQGESHGYWAGRICDAIFDWDDPATTTPYWVNEGYKSRGQCVSAHVGWLKEGNAVPPWA